MSLDSKIRELEEKIKEMDTSVKEMNEQEAAYEGMGMADKAKRAKAKADGYYEEWLRLTTELANLVKEMKRGR